MSKPRDPCKKLACAIQSCLSAHNFQESACLKEIENLRNCCKKWKDVSLVCSGMRDSPVSELSSNNDTKQIPSAYAGPVQKFAFINRYPRLFVCGATIASLWFMFGDIAVRIYKNESVDSPLRVNQREVDYELIQSKLSGWKV